MFWKTKKQDEPKFKKINTINIYMKDGKRLRWKIVR